VLLCAPGEAAGEGTSLSPSAGAGHSSSLAGVDTLRVAAAHLAASGCEAAAAEAAFPDPLGSAIATPGSAASAWRISYLPPKISRGSFDYLPEFHYSSQAGTTFGGDLVYTLPRFGHAPRGRPSDLRAQARVGFSHYFTLALVSRVYWSDDRYYSKARVGYSDLPRAFYGIGPDAERADREIYRPRILRAYVELFRHVWRSLKVGARAEFEYAEALAVEADGLLDTPAGRAAIDKSIVGCGLAFDWDTRDCADDPAAGSYHQAFVLPFTDETGSQRSFTNYNVDLRHYQRLGHEQVLATQAFVYGASGDAPFWRLATLGGRAHSRAYSTGRYRDQLLLAAQTEYRFPLWRRLRGVAFAGAALVGPDLGSLDAADLQPTIGAGLRLRYSATRRLPLSFDFAYGRESTRALITLGHAF
jgi:hypothetical protein